VTDILRIYTFGGLSIQQVDTPVKGFVSRKVEALLLYLVYNRWEHPRELLAELLWTDQAQGQALTNLRAAVASLQNHLAPYLLVTRQTMAVNPEANIWLDSQTLEAGLDAAEQQLALRGIMSRTAASALEEALNLFKGDFLAGFNLRDSREFEGWQTLERERLRGRVIEAQHHLVNHYLETQQYSAGIALAKRLLQLDPLWEEAHRQMMLLLARSGQRGGALSHFASCREVLTAELGVEPDPETTSLRARIEAGQIAVVSEVAMPQHNLPIPSTPFIDRPAEVAQVTGLLGEANCRLVTILGSGGSGKTRLALQAATIKLPDFSEGVFLVQLAPVQSAEFILSAVLDALKINANRQDEARPQLLKYLSNRHLLLVLDNFEHVLDGAELLLELLASAPDVKLLVTSRERLNVQEEWIVAIDGMAYPSSLDDDFGKYNAVQLFVQSARRVEPDFVLADNAPALMRICQLAQGMPLGIELAAAWLRVMPCSQIADEVERSLDILQTSVRNVPGRHRSIRATFESSWKLLTDAERQVLQRLSVFRGRFHQQAAQEVTGASALTSLALTDKSLLRATEGYFGVHELLRQFAAEKLAQQPGESERIRAAHCAYYAAFLGKREHRLSGDVSQAIVREVKSEIENVRVAWEYALEQADANSVVAFFRPMYNYFDVQCRYHEGEELFRRAAERFRDARTDDLIPARALVLQGSMYVCMGRYDEGQAVIDQGFPALDYQTAPWESRIALASLATIHYALGRYFAAADYYERAFELYRDAGATVEAITTLVRLSDIATVLGDYEKARRIFQENLPMLGKVAGTRSRILFLTTLGDLEHKLGDFSSARQHFSESLVLSENANDLTGMGVALVSLGRVAHALGAYSDAAEFCARSIAVCSETRNQWGKSFALTHLGRAYQALGEDDRAKQQYVDALAICEQVGNRWVLAFTLRQLAQTLLVLGDVKQAVTRAFTAFEVANELCATPLVLDTLVGIGLVVQRLGHAADARQLIQFVMQHPTSEYSTREDAKQLSAALQYEWESAKTRTLTLEAVAQYVSALKAALYES
jgi:predicted ATPase/DNA-binding SARP family transcriptional activator